MKDDIKDQLMIFDKIDYYRYPKSKNSQPFKYRLSYTFDNGKPHRWIELDSLGRMTTDYIYEYDSLWVQTGARYREDSAQDWSIERVRYLNDSTTVTEWIDSIGQVYYRMIDDLNTDGKTYRATFIGDETHGYDSTFYTIEGFEKRIFFTNVKGKIYNDRSFIYDSVNLNNDWVQRKKIMNDTIRELQLRNVSYDESFTITNPLYYQGIISTGEYSENVINFTKDESVAFLTRTKDWIHQSGFILLKSNGIYKESIAVSELDSIYNGAISPDGSKIIFSVRENEKTEIWLLEKVDSRWSKRSNLTNSSTVEGGYFYWLDDDTIYFQSSQNNGDISVAKLINDRLEIINTLDILNTEEGSEFSPYVDTELRFIIFTRYIEGDTSQQGFFISYNSQDKDSPVWSKPEKIQSLPYGWSPNIINGFSEFLYTDGENIYCLPLETLNLDI